MAVTANQLVNREDGNYGGGPVLTSITLYIGTLAFIDAANGFITNVVNSGANKFAGITRDYVDNSSGASGDKKIILYERGTFELEGAGFTQADVGKKAYASDNFTVTTTATSNTYIGTITRVISATKIQVALDVQLP